MSLLLLKDSYTIKQIWWVSDDIKSKDNFLKFSIKTCGYLLESCWQGSSNDYPQHIFKEKYGKLSLHYHKIPSLPVTP